MSNRGKRNASHHHVRLDMGDGFDDIAARQASMAPATSSHLINISQRVVQPDVAASYLSTETWALPSGLRVPDNLEFGLRDANDSVDFNEEYVPPAPTSLTATGTTQSKPKRSNVSVKDFCVAHKIKVFTHLLACSTRHDLIVNG